jgi:hypothetical protein
VHPSKALAVYSLWRWRPVGQTNQEHRMIAIVISACLLSDPGVCKDYRIPLASGIDATRCMTDAPPHFATWADAHPGWRIARWRCLAGTEDL